MINKPKKPLTDVEQLLIGSDEDDRETILKMIEIYNALLYGGIELNIFNYKKNYSLDFYKIMLMVEDDKKDYSDATIKALINTLYNKMFKNRRY